MRIIFTIIFIIVALFLQIGILPHLGVVGAFPNLILLSILALSVLLGWKKIIGWIILGGLFLDFYSLNSVLGASVIALIFVCYLAYYFSQDIFKKASLGSIILIFLINIIAYNGLVILTNGVFGAGFNFNFLSFFIGIVYNLIFAIPIFYLLKRYAKQI